MQRATPLDSSFRAYVSGGARGCTHEADDTKLLQEVKVNFMKNETRDKVERPQNYGFTGYFRKAEYKNGQIEKCAEHFSHFMGGNRSFPVCEAVDDRRYRLRNFLEGETAVYDDQQQKVHIQRDRIYARSQYKVEMRVIKDQAKMEGHGKDKEADRDQQKDKSRRWSTMVMDKDTITIERTDITGDSDGSDAKTQDEAEKHIVMLSRVFLDAMHIHIFTPTISIQWDEEKRTLVLNTEKNTMTFDDKNPEKAIALHTPNLDVVLNEKMKQVQVGNTDAKIPAAMLGSIDSNGDVIVGKVAKKVVVI